MLEEKHNTFLAITITVFGILLIFVDYFNKSFISFFEGNLLAELIGICIELFIIIVVFEKWQENKKKQEMIVHEKRLREYLINFLKHGLKNISKDLKVGKFYGKNRIENNEDIKKLIDYISEKDLDNELLINIKKHLNTDKTAFENLLGVSSKLTDSHFKSWIRIVYFINEISNTDDIPKVKNYLINILRNINRFDKASFDSKIYVGAK